MPVPSTEARGWAPIPRTYAFIATPGRDRDAATSTPSRSRVTRWAARTALSGRAAKRAPAT
ncbi:hypothetical protein Psuf_073560 [Phytohabitans suffuscus]|uniref:Uncharacterized protein n=1 Tax=Phytohabitans suffuscus TaxID=624315 RepID=A0A6F8YVL9_9ACTN|nr:hypothetical protein Psuf_073560 [Phytohabitans suffuscus]